MAEVPANLEDMEISERVKCMAEIFFPGDDRGGMGESPNFKKDFNQMWEILKAEIGEELDNPKKVAYLAAYSILGSVTYSCKCAGITNPLIYTWKKDDPLFVEYYEMAEQAHTEYMEIEAQRRAVMGVPEEVYYQGEVVGHKRNYSDSLLQFLLKGKRPDKYGNTSKLEIKNQGDANIQVNFGIPELNQDMDTEEVEKVEGE